MLYTGKVRAPVIRLARRLHDFYREIKVGAKTLFQPYAITPEGLFMPIPDRKIPSERIQPVPSHIYFAMATGREGGGISEIEKTLWLYVCIDHSAASRDKVKDLLANRDNDSAVQGFLDEALNDKVLPAGVALRLGATLHGGVEHRFSQDTYVWDIAAQFYHRQADWDKVIEFGDKFYARIKAARRPDQGTILTRAECARWVGEALIRRWHVELSAGGEVNRANKFMRRAIPYLKDSLNVNSTDEVAFALLLEAYCRLGLHQENRRLINQTRRAYAGQPSLLFSFYVWRALLDSIVFYGLETEWAVAEAIQQFEAIEQDTQALLPHTRENVRVWSHLMGVLYALYGDYNKAVVYLQRKGNWETDPQFVYYMAYSQFKRGNTEEAKRLVVVLENLDRNHRGLAELREWLFPPPASTQAQPAAVTELHPVPVLPEKESPLISGEEFREALFGEGNANHTRLFTEDRPTRRAIADALNRTLDQYLSVIREEGWEAIQELYLGKPVDILPLVEERARNVLSDVLGISAIEIHPASSREIRIRLSGERYKDRYYTVRIGNDLSFEFSGAPNLRELEVLLKAVVLEGILALLEEGQSYGEVMKALEARPEPLPKPIDWEAIGREAQAVRQLAEQQRAAREAEEAKRKAEEAAKIPEPVALEEGFYSSNSEVYTDLYLTVDSLGIDLLAEEQRTDETINSCLLFLASSREIDAPVHSFVEEIPSDDLLSPAVKRIRMYGPIRAPETLRAKNLQTKTISALGFGEEASKSAFLGLYELECEIEGETRILTAVLDAGGRTLAVLGLSEADRDPLLHKSLHKIILERLVYKTARAIVDLYGAEKVPADLSTERKEFLRGVVLSLEEQMGTGVSQGQRVKALDSAAELLEFDRIVRTGLEKEPLYVKHGGVYRRVRSTDVAYRTFVVSPPEERFVRMKPGYAVRLRLGPKTTPRARSQSADPHYYEIGFSPEGNVMLKPDWQPLTWEKIFEVRDTQIEGKSLLPFEISDYKREAYLREGANRLASDLEPTLMVYAVTAYEDSDEIVYIPRNISGKTIEEVQEKLAGSPGQVKFLQRFLVGKIDELKHASVSAENRERLKGLGVKRRLVIVMQTNVGYWEGKFWSHAKFWQEEAKRRLNPGQ